ncbi:MAG: hypothetical protein RLZZ370_1508, partial [Bacteroidota bacterium]
MRNTAILPAVINEAAPMIVRGVPEIPSGFSASVVAVAKQNAAEL